jgi:flagellar basal-body rod protein FlgF
MIEGLYGAASGMAAAERLHEVVAFNLAYSRLHGYQRRAVAFAQPAAEETQEDHLVLLGAETLPVQVSFQTGPLERTDNPLDVALTGEGFFELLTPEGPLYTRNGVFQLGPDGTLLSASGYPVSGGGTPIVVPPETSALVIRPDGTVLANNDPVGLLQVVRFQRPDLLEPVSPTLFRAPAAAGLIPVEEMSVMQGYRESSNVEPVVELLQLIVATRFHEAAQRALQALDRTLEAGLQQAAT